MRGRERPVFLERRVLQGYRLYERPFGVGEHRLSQKGECHGVAGVFDSVENCPGTFFGTTLPDTQI